MDMALETRFAYPTITYWNRLESRPRTDNFERALRAEVRDPLWMLCKQWQMGEFEGDDAGSPAQAKVQLAFTPLVKYQPGSSEAIPFDIGSPLEVQMEQMPIPLQAGSQELGLDIRLLTGRRWMSMLAKAGLQAYTQEFLKEAFWISKIDPTDEAHVQVVAHSEVWQQWSAVAGKAIDGIKWVQHLKPETKATWFSFIASAPNEDTLTMLTSLAEKFVEWFEMQFTQSAKNTAWVPEQLEYQASCALPENEQTEKIITASEYYHGRLDWYNFDIDKAQSDLSRPVATPGSNTQTLSFLPTPISFNGMPNTRWWTFEDGKTNFGDIKPDTSDIAKLLLIEFGLVYANDWFMLPYTVPIGSMVQVKGLAVTNVFGERFWIEPSGKGADQGWQEWRMFNLSIKGNAKVAASNDLLLLPTVAKIQESKPLEESMLVRDEVANMVWAIETVIPSPIGVGKPGKDAASETRRYFQKRYEDKTNSLPTPSNSSSTADLRYQLMTEVPENWIPFIAVKVQKNNVVNANEIQLQRSSMLRILPGMPPLYSRIKPRNVLLRDGLDTQSLPKRPYYVKEEEVPRAGIKVTQSYQRTRWLDGKVFTWLGVRKQTGRGEGHSGLAFDQIVSSK